MGLIPMDTVRKHLLTQIARETPYLLSQQQKLENIYSFNSLPREGLVNGVIEQRILLYQTRMGEKVYMQYPGTESTRTNDRKFPLDAKPVLQKADGTYMEDMDFKKIWDIIDRIGEGHKDDLDILATLFLRIAYMIDYQHKNDEYLCETVDMVTGETVCSESIRLVWNSFHIHNDVLDTLNDRFGSFKGMSLEGFLYYNDLLAQNEDCKYSYLKAGQWQPTTGRINNCLSHLTIISHLKGHIGISKLIDSFQRTGVAPLPQSRFSEACGDLVQRV